MSDPLQHYVWKFMLRRFSSGKKACSCSTICKLR